MLIATEPLMIYFNFRLNQVKRANLNRFIYKYNSK